MALASTFKIEVKDSGGTWRDITSSVQTLSDGTTSSSQIIPTVNLTFGRDDDNVDQYFDSTVNQDEARIRVTENTTTTYYLLERDPGTVTRNETNPTITGRAFCGRIVDFPKLNYVNIVNMTASSIARQICIENTATQSGDVIPVAWNATEDPTVPAKRWEFNRADRLSTLRDIAESCGAGVRASSDGLGFEVYDIPTKALTDSASFNFDNALSLSYSTERVDKPLNAIRVKGAAFDYSIGKIPRLNVYIQPDSIPANGTSTAIGYAQVFTAAGIPVQHKYINQQAIDADSFTTIPVSGCYGDVKVWLNDGTQSVPVLGDRIDITSFTASEITVPTQATDLFIVSYTQAESVSWAIEDYADTVRSEAQTTTGTLAVSTTNNIGQVIGVYRASDTNKTGTNYYTGGSFTENTTSITLGISPGATGQSVIIDYVKYNATPLTGVNVSPSSSLCDRDGIALTTIGSGTAVGVGFLVASSLGQQGETRLSLTGTAVGSLTLSANPGVIRKGIEAETIVNTYTAEAQTLVSDSDGKYFELDNQIFLVKSVTVTGDPSAVLTKWENVGASYRAYVSTSASAGANGLITYDGFASVSEEDKTSTITANVLDTSGAAVSDGTTVYFEFVGSALGCTLSAEPATTSGGEASISLTSGNISGVVTVLAIVGGYRASVDIEITDQDVIGGTTTSSGASGGWDDNTNEEGEGIVRKDRPGLEFCKTVPNDSNDADGSVSGARRLVDCDGRPLVGQTVQLSDGSIVQTDSQGFFRFSNGSTGENTVSVNGGSYSFDISPQNSEDRGGGTNICTDSKGNITYTGGTLEEIS